MITLTGGPHDGTEIEDPGAFIRQIDAWHFVFGDIAAGGTAQYRINHDRTIATFIRMVPIGSHEN